MTDSYIVYPCGCIEQNGTTDAKKQPLPNNNCQWFAGNTANDARMDRFKDKVGGDVKKVQWRCERKNQNGVPVPKAVADVVTANNP